MPAPLNDDQIAAFRQQICEVAARQFAGLGIEKVSMRSLAQELGCSATSLYNYFANKEALLAATRARAYDQLSDALEAAMASSSDLWQQSRAIGDAYIVFASEHPAAYQLIFALHQPAQTLYPELAVAENRANGYMTRYVENMVAAGLLEGDPTTLAHIYWAGMHGLILLRMAGKFSASPLNFEQLRHDMMRLITRGALPR